MKPNDSNTAEQHPSATCKKTKSRKARFLEIVMGVVRIADFALRLWDKFFNDGGPDVD